jgi:asparaginyl-tRNA synthetase
MQLVQAPKSWKDLQEHYLTALQNPWYRTLIEIQDVISTSTYQFFAKRGLKTIHVPITTHSISSPMGLGSDSKPVNIHLFGVDTYLADSMQFMLEYGCRLNAEGCFYLMPSFRGESADETHLCQFYHSEAEIQGSIDDVMSLVEDYLRFMTESIFERCRSSILTVTDDLSHVEALLESDKPLARVTLDEAGHILGQDPALIQSREPGFRVLTRAGERALIEHFGGFVWLTEQDHLAVPFYQAFADAEGTKARASDLLFGLGEVVGSGERHATSQDLQRALDLHQVDPTPYTWYAKMREDYPMQTSGFGIGTERYICWLLNHDDVRDCQILPRFNGVAVIP